MFDRVHSGLELLSLGHTPQNTTHFAELDFDTAMNVTKEKILTVAIDLFSRQGFTSVSIRDISREVGIKESSLYNHFRNKDQILDTIFQIFRSRYKKLTPPKEMLDEILTKMNPEDFLKYGIQLYMDLVDDPIMGKIWRILNMEQYRDPRARDIFLGDIIHGTLLFLEEAFKRMIVLGSIKPLNPALLAAEYQYSVFAMAMEYNMLKFQNMDTTQIKQRMSEHIDFFLQSIRL
jgi:AcrR family transcriptional regulator